MSAVPQPYRDVRVINDKFGLWKPGFFQMPLEAWEELEKIFDKGYSHRACDRTFKIMTSICTWHNIVPASPSSIADKVGISRNKVYRALAHLEREGVIYKVPTEELPERFPDLFGKDSTNGSGLYYGKYAGIKFVYVISDRYFSRGKAPIPEGRPGKPKMRQRKPEHAQQTTGTSYNPQHALSLTSQEQEERTRNALARFSDLRTPSPDEAESDGLKAFLSPAARREFMGTPEDINDLYTAAEIHIKKQVNKGCKYANSVLQILF